MAEVAEDRGKRASSRRPRLQPAFVVTAARSGSTLLRYLLDSHPEVTSPHELNLTNLLHASAEQWRLAEAVTSGESGRRRDASVPLSATVRRRARKPIDELMRHYADAAGATVFCDKSLVTVDHLPTVVQCYPDARYIFLYRYPLDMIASGLEASKWGYNAFGFAPFVHAIPGNFIAGLTNYWIDRASKMLLFERNNPEVAHTRVYYESLCDDPTGTLDRLFAFLDVAPDPDVLERVFDTEHGEGPGDYKIDFTGSINVGSIGRGAIIPDAMADDQSARVDALLGELDYPDLASARRGQLAALMGLRHAVRRGADAEQLLALVQAALSRRAVGKLSAAHRRFFPLEVVVRTGSVDSPVLLVDADGVSRVTERGAVSSVNGSAPNRVRCSGEVILQIVDGRTTFAQAVHERHIIVEQGEVAGEEPQRELPRRVLAALAALVRE